MSRDVLAPPLQRMGGNRCYRVNLVHEDFGGQPVSRRSGGKPAKSSGYVEEDLYTEDDFDDDPSIVEVTGPNSLFKLSLHIPPSLYGGLIGFKGSTKRRIECETQTEIFVPRQREGSKSAEAVTIKGKLRANVLAAKRKILLLTSSLRCRMRATHFLCVDLTNEEFQQNFEDFKKKILEAELPGISEDLFQSSVRMHLTLCVCVLLDDRERTRAVELLQSCRNFLTDVKSPFELKVTGLEIMNDDPSAVKVLYACVEAPQLQQFADHLYHAFRQEGFSFDEFGRDTVKLHMTVMNGAFRKKQQPNASKTFDAREILKRYSDYHFGRAQCDEVKLCVLGESKGPTDAYKVTGSLKF